MSEKSTIVRIINWAARGGSVLAPGLAAWVLERLFLTPRLRAASEQERRWLAAAESTELEFDSVRSLPIYRWPARGRDGQAASDRPTVLLVHGWSGRGSQLGAFIEPLVKRGFSVVAFDGPGHAQSAPGLSGLPEMAAAIEKVGQRLGPIEAVIAHSLGTSATTMALASGGLDARRAVYFAPPDTPGTFLARTARMLGFSSQVVVRAQARIERRFGIRFDRLDGNALAPTIRVPLLVFHDRDDREVPFEQGRKLVGSWPGARLVATTGRGHNRILRTPELVKAAAEFLVPSVRPETAFQAAS